MAINKNKVMDAARKAYEKGQFDKAVKEYLRVVKEDPKDVRVWLKIGDLYAKKGSKQEATDTYLKVATFYSEQGFYRKAVAVYKQILKLDPRLVDVNLKLAELYRQLGLLSDAMQHFEMVAAFFHREGKTREALATIRQLVELDPENVATRIKLAELYSKEGMNDEAVAEFAHACEYLRKHNRQDDFIKVAERLLFHDQERIGLCRELASLYLRRDDPRRALAKLQMCFKADAGDVETLALLAQAFQKLDQKGKTVSVLKELAKVLTEGGERAKAEEVHRKILAYVPTDPDSLAFLGMKAPGPASAAAAAAAQRPARNEPPRLEISKEIAIPSRRHGGGGPIGRTTGAMPLVRPPTQGGSFPESSVADHREGDDDFELDLDESSQYEAVEGSSVGGELHSDEIEKILTETDVYVKYGLHQKAIDHLRRVFDLDPENVEARERLKDILVGQGREEDAVRELIGLAELTAPANPQRAGGYVAEVLAIDPSNQPARDLASRYRLAIGGDAKAGPVAGISDELDFDDLDFDDVDPLAPPRTDTTASVTRREDVDFDFDDLGGGRASDAPITMEVDLDQVEDSVSVADVDADALDFDVDPPGDPLAPPSFDPAAAAAFDADRAGAPVHVGHEPPTDAGDSFAPPDDGPVFGATDAEVDFLGEDDVEELDPDEVQELSHSELRDFSSDPAPPLDPAFDPSAPSLDVNTREEPPSGAEPASSTSLEDDLDEADFFLTQGLFDEARDILQALLGRYPNHPLVTSKLQELEQMEAGEPGPSTDDFIAPAEEFLTEEEPRPTGQRAQSVVLEKPVDDEDADTHYDLGLAYKEMGLFGEAIQAFQKVLSVRGREVQCHLMIGLCQREQGNHSEAINQFKTGLYADRITPAEKFGLFYEIGVAYEALQDPQEALYYFEMVLKKDPRYRDVAARVEALKAAGASASSGRDERPSTLDDETDEALDQLLADDHRR